MQVRRDLTERINCKKGRLLNELTAKDNGNKKRTPQLFGAGRLICSKTSNPVASNGNFVFVLNPLLMRASDP